MLLLFSDFQSIPSTSKGPMKKKSKSLFNLDSEIELEASQNLNDDEVSMMEGNSKEDYKAYETGEIV